MPTPKQVSDKRNKQHLGTIESLKQKARVIAEAHADHLLDLRENHKAELAEAKRLHALAVEHERELGVALKNVVKAINPF